MSHGDTALSPAQQPRYIGPPALVYAYDALLCMMSLSPTK